MPCRVQLCDLLVASLSAQPVMVGLDQRVGINSMAARSERLIACVYAASSDEQGDEDLESLLAAMPYDAALKVRTQDAFSTCLDHWSGVQCRSVCIKSCMHRAPLLFGALYQTPLAYN